MVIVPLLDRLADAASAGDDESVSSRSHIRRAAAAELVARELGLLLNAHGLGATKDLSRYPEVMDSVLNYGLPSLAGSAASDIVASRVAERIRRVITVFEPRLQDVAVTLLPTPDSGNNVRYVVHGRIDIAGQPAPVALETRISIGDGSVSVQPGSGGA